MYIIDRFENKYAICENDNKETYKIPISLIPQDAIEGDILIKSEEIYIIDKERTNIRREKIKKKMKSLFE